MELLYVVLTSLLSVVALFLIAKLMGHRQISQLDVFDYITGITIGSIAAEMATNLEEPLRPLIAMAVYGLSTVTLNVITSKFAWTRKYINGLPLVIMNNGKIYRENMKKAKLDLSEFLVLCRQEGYFNLNNIQTAVFEFNGKMTFLPTSDSRPIAPEDIGLKLQKETTYTEIIMDGHLLEKNLTKLGLEQTWLGKQLHAQGYSSASQIFLGLCDENKELLLFSMK